MVEPPGLSSAEAFQLFSPHPASRGPPAGCSTERLGSAASESLEMSPQIKRATCSPRLGLREALLLRLQQGWASSPFLK